MEDHREDEFLRRLSEELAVISTRSFSPMNMLRHIHIRAGEPSEKKKGGIGELAEKSLHQLLKRCYASESAHQEVPLGRYIADVYDGERIVEIQTGGMARLLPKLREFLTIAPVTVVYPMTRIKYLSWIDPETGELTKPRKGPKQGRPIEALHELYPLRELLLDPRLTVELLLFDLDEYRLLCGYSKDRKKGSVRSERIPRSLAGRYILREARDYAALLPSMELLPNSFTAAELRKAVKLQSRPTYSAIHLLETLGLLCAKGKQGRAMLYEWT